MTQHDFDEGAGRWRECVRDSERLLSGVATVGRLETNKIMTRKITMKSKRKYGSGYREWDELIFLRRQSAPCAPQRHSKK